MLTVYIVRFNAIIRSLYE